MRTQLLNSLTANELKELAIFDDMRPIAPLERERETFVRALRSIRRIFSYASVSWFLTPDDLDEVAEPFEDEYREEPEQEDDDCDFHGKDLREQRDSLDSFGRMMAGEIVEEQFWFDSDDKLDVFTVIPCGLDGRMIETHYQGPIEKRDEEKGYRLTDDERRWLEEGMNYVRELMDNRPPPRKWKELSMQTYDRWFDGARRIHARTVAKKRRQADSRGVKCDWRELTMPEVYSSTGRSLVEAEAYYAAKPKPPPEPDEGILDAFVDLPEIDESEWIDCAI